MNMDISVVILSWNDKVHLEECLRSLEHCTISRSVEIIVVDNASTDGSPELVKNMFPNVKLIANKENVGFPRGNNMGIKAAQGKYLFILNSDIKVLKSCVDALADYMDAHPDVGMIGPRILNGDGTHQSSCRIFPTLWNNFCETSGLARTFPESKFFSGEHMFYFKGDAIRDVDVLVGCFWAVRREAIEQFGLLDEGFFLYAEDVDWCIRCHKAGWRVVFYPAVEAIHYRGASTTKKDPVRFALLQQRSVLRFWRKHHGLMHGMAIRGLLLVHHLLRWSVAFLKHLVGKGNREENATKIHVTAACARALFWDPQTN